MAGKERRTFLTAVVREVNRGVGGAIHFQDVAVFVHVSHQQIAQLHLLMRLRTDDVPMQVDPVTLILHHVWGECGCRQRLRVRCGVYFFSSSHDNRMTVIITSYKV